MKLLLDQNISFQLVKKISHLFPETLQVKEAGIENYTDSEIWEFAKKNGYTIVSFDADFYELSILKKQPPKVIWLRTGNTSTDNLVNIFKDNYEVIEEFLNNESYKDIGCLEID
jgi:predicted nuclease of predicted toxin-antitoxin system